MSFLTRTLTPAHANRARLHITLIPLYVWIAFAWTGYVRSVMTPGPLDKAGLIKGHDFVHFYVLGQVALERKPVELYDYGALAKRTDRLAGYEDHYVPAYGPQVALLFAPLAWLPYDIAWRVWAAVSALVYGISWYALWRSEPVLRSYKWATFIAAVGYPAFAMLIGFGHISSLALAAFTGAYLAFRADRLWVAGLAIGCLFIKPPLGVILPLVLLYSRAWRVVAGAAAAITLQLAIAWAYFGSAALLAYWSAVTEFGDIAAELEPQPHQMQSLRSFFSVLVPWSTIALACYGAAALITVVVAARSWRSTAPLPLRYAILLIAVILVDPHVNVYDLVILAPIFVLLGAWGLRRSAGRLLWLGLGFCFYAPIFSHVASALFHVQLEVAALMALLVLVATQAHFGLPDG